jgi:MFS family permease
MTTQTEVASLPWYRTVTLVQRRAFIAAGLGWMLESMDWMMYSMVLSYLMRDLAMSRSTAGLLGSIGILAAAVGGVVFGVVADWFGRTRALIATILIYSLFTAACGFSQSVMQLAIFRILVGIGMGGEWATGAALVAETWPDEHRGKVLGLMQSFWAVGQALAAVVTAVVFPLWGWRSVFFVGVAPALVIMWIRRSVEEPAIWRQSRVVRRDARPKISLIFAKPLGGLTLALTLVQIGTMFAWWGLNAWIPAYLSLPIAEGGLGLSAVKMSAFVIVMQVGAWLGYVSYGFISDRVGRKRTYVVYLVSAAALLPFYGLLHVPALLLALGPLIAFFGTGHFSGMGVVTAEIFPTEIRATAQGFVYNIGRAGGAVAPLVVGSLAQSHGFGAAFAATAAAFVFSASMWIFIPETKGRKLV